MPAQNNAPTQSQSVDWKKLKYFTPFGIGQIIGEGIGRLLYKSNVYSKSLKKYNQAINKGLDNIYLAKKSKNNLGYVLNTATGKYEVKGVAKRQKNDDVLDIIESANNEARRTGNVNYIERGYVEGLIRAQAGNQVANSLDALLTGLSNEGIVNVVPNGANNFIVSTEVEANELSCYAEEGGAIKYLSKKNPNTASGRIVPYSKSLFREIGGDYWEKTKQLLSAFKNQDVNNVPLKNIIIKQQNNVLKVVNIDELDNYKDTGTKILLTPSVILARNKLIKSNT